MSSKIFFNADIRKCHCEPCTIMVQGEGEARSNLKRLLRRSAFGRTPRNDVCENLRPRSAVRLSIYVFFILIVDQLTKFFFDNSLSLGESLPIIRGVFHITLVHNRGGAFGLFTNVPWVFVAVAVLTSGAILYILLKGNAGRFEVPLEVILAGAVGNLLDRVRLGYVIDFIDLRIWPVFNVSDSAVTLGTVWLAYRLFKNSKSEIRNNVNNQTPRNNNQTMTNNQIPRHKDRRVPARQLAPARHLAGGGGRLWRKITKQNGQNI